jgi:hypothetical protein
MPISPYLRPQDTITQILRNTAAPAIARRNPVVIGPQYLIQINDGRELNKTVFSSLGVVDYGYKMADGSTLNLNAYLPHAASAKLFGEDLEALVGSITATRVGVTNDSITSGANNFKGGTLNGALDGRAVKVGDVFSVTVSGSPAVRRTVTALLPKMSAATSAKSVATTNLAGGVANLIELVPGSNGNWTTPTVVAAPIADFLPFGGGHLTLASVKRLGEQVTVTLENSVIGTGARFTVAGLTSGLSATAVVPTVAGNVYTISLAGAGYAGSSVTLTRVGTPQLGETITARVFPTYTAPSSAVVTVSGTYTATVSRRYVLEVTAGAATLNDVVFRIFDTSGVESIQSGITNIGAGTVSVGSSGLSIAVADFDLYTGCKFYIDGEAAAAVAGEFNGVKLSGPILDSTTYSGAAITADVFQPFTGELTNANVATGEAFTATALTTSYAATLGLPATATGRLTSGISPFANGVGHVLLSYKAAVIPAETEGAISITSASSMASLVGEPHLENWLGRGVFEAFTGNQSQRVYALRTLGDTVEDFDAALRKIRSTDVYYALAVMSDDIDVKQAVIAHCDEMSNKFNKNFRRCYVGTDSPGQYTVWGALSGGGYRLGSVASQIFTIRVADRVHGSFTAADVGSFISMPELGAAPVAITQVYNSYEVKLDCDIAAVVVDSAFSLIRSDTSANTVRFLQEVAATLGSRRCVNVWTDRASTFSGTGSEVIPNKFIAAEIAGLRCALLPQQGLTMTEIKSVTAAPAMYTRFTPEQLDDISAAGNMVVTQESEGGDIYIRHQLTTNTADGALAYEDNVGVIVDEFSYRVKDTFRSYIGKRNATQNTVSEIEDKLRELAVDATQADLRDTDIGPMVLRFFDEAGKEGSVTVRVDGVLADHILTYVKLRVPLPLNGIDHYIDVETSNEL